MINWPPLAKLAVLSRPLIIAMEKRQSGRGTVKPSVLRISGLAGPLTLLTVLRIFNCRMILLRPLGGRLACVGSLLACKKAVSRA